MYIKCIAIYTLYIYTPESTGGRYFTIIDAAALMRKKFLDRAPKSREIVVGRGRCCF
nr:hypothetical protein Q903MT_gene2971 [Picea sitchensis]